MAAPLREFTHGTFDADAALAQISDEEFNQAFVASMRLLGTLFVASPKTQDFKRALEAVRSLDLGQDWPFGGEDDLARAAELFRQGAAEEDDEELLRSYQRLFRGPNSLPAPPWGSVYMDRDQVMYGWTWNELKAWMRSNGVEGTYEENDPEDHIGRLMLMAAAVAEERPACLCELLADHLLCWSDHFLAYFGERAASPTYLGIAALSRTTLLDVQEILGIEPATRKFFR